MPGEGPRVLAGLLRFPRQALAVHPDQEPARFCPFARVRLRTDKTGGCVSRDTMLALVFKLGQSAATRWRRLRGFRMLPKVYEGTRFQDGQEVTVEQEASRSTA